MKRFIASMLICVFLVTSMASAASAYTVIVNVKKGSAGRYRPVQLSNYQGVRNGTTSAMNLAYFYNVGGGKGVYGWARYKDTNGYWHGWKSFEIYSWWSSTITVELTN